MSGERITHFYCYFTDIMSGDVKYLRLCGIIYSIPQTDRQ